jgi:hypothetical protein
MKPVVSVIVPYLNAEPYLAEAIASVEQQTFLSWELILVDDGSTDGSRALADVAAKRDPRVRSLARPDEIAGGAAAARNWGIAQAVGDYLVFLDADDRLLPDKLSTDFELISRHPEVAMTIGRTVWWYPGEERRNWTDGRRSTRPGMQDGVLLLNRAVLMQRLDVPCLCAIMVRRSALPPGPAFEEGFALYEDQTLLVKMMLRAPVYVSRHLTALYRQHPHSTSARAEEAGEYDRLAPHGARRDFLRWVCDYARASGRREASIDEALAVAEAIQSGDRSQLTPVQRAMLRRFAVQDRLRRVFWLGRRILRLPGDALKALSARSSTPVSGG